MTVIAIGDTHHPYCERKHLDRILDHVARLQPEHVVQMGDLYDLYSFSRYPRSLNLASPRDELTEARAAAEAMWLAVQLAAPKARCHQLLGNHDDRIHRSVMARAPELEAVLEALDFRSLWRFPGVVTQQDSRDELVLAHVDRGEPVMFLHGHRRRLGDHVRYNLTSTVVGHTHHGGVFYQRYHGRTLWELNSGFLADVASVPLAYSAQRLSSSVPGFGVIDDDGPRFIPL